MIKVPDVGTSQVLLGVAVTVAIALVAGLKFALKLRTECGKPWLDRVKFAEAEISGFAVGELRALREDVDSLLGDESDDVDPSRMATIVGEDFAPVESHADRLLKSKKRFKRMASARKRMHWGSRALILAMSVFLLGVVLLITFLLGRVWISAIREDTMCVVGAWIAFVGLVGTVAAGVLYAVSAGQMDKGENIVERLGGLNESG